MHNVLIALQELPAVMLILHRIAFHLYAKVIAFALDSSTAKAYLCSQGGTVSLSRLACHTLKLADKQSMTYSSIQT